MSNKVKFIFLGIGAVSFAAGTVLKSHETFSAILFGTGLLSVIVAMFGGGGC